MSWSHASEYRHAASSSAHARSWLGPRRRSGSSAEYADACEPLWNVTLRFDGSYCGRWCGGNTVSRPDSPSIMTSRTSAAVAPTRAICFAVPLFTCSRTNSAPVRVLPNPRPARISHVRQLPSGVDCFGRRHRRQSYSTSRCCSGDRPPTSSVSCSGVSPANTSAHDFSVTLCWLHVENV